MIQLVRMLLPLLYRGFCWAFFIVLVVAFPLSAQALAQEEISPKTVLTTEIDRMLDRTLRREFSGSHRGLLGRRIEDYRKALRQLRDRLQGDAAQDRNEVFDQFEAILEAGVALRAEQHEDIDEKFDQLREVLEEQRKDAEDVEGRLRVGWLKNYDQRLRPDDDFHKHQAVLIRAFGLWASGFVSTDKVYRFENTLRMAERLFPEVLRELFETDTRSRHYTRLYVQVLELLESRKPWVEDSTMLDRFRRHLRRSGGTIFRLERAGVISSVPENLEETIRSLSEQ